MPSVSDVVDEGPAAKRQRLQVPDAVVAPSRRGPRTSTLFAPYRTLGLVSSTAVPFTSLPLGKTSFQISTSVGRSLQTYDLKRGLNLVFVTRPQTPGLITATTSRGKQVFAAWTEDEAPIVERKKGIWVYERGKRVAELPIPLDLDEDIVQLHTFGSWILACCSTRIEVWSASSLEHYVSLHPHSNLDAAVLTGGLCILPTYTNKILAGREDGTVEIWNVSTARLLYTIQPPTSDCGPVTALQLSPAVGIVATAYMNGYVILHDVEADQQVIALTAGQGDQSPITTISFRMDGLGAGPDGRESGVMATASYNSGDVVLWNLNEGGKKMGTLRNAHAAPTEARSFNDGGVSKIEFLPGQALLVTSGLDNALRSWIFDQTPFSPIPRPLHSRSGHAAPVTNLAFLPSDADGADAGGKWLLSTSKDRSFWGWSLRRDGQSTELSQGSVQKKAKSAGMSANGAGSHHDTPQDHKASRITCLACSMNRDGGMGAMPGVKTLWTDPRAAKGTAAATEHNITGWESVVTGHEGDKYARTWFWGRKRAGRWKFATADGTEVRSVAISPCGTFALIGSAAGGIDMFNLQSGSHRQRFPARLTKAQAQKAQQNGLKALDVSSTEGAVRKWPKGHGRHTDAVTGLLVDSMNRTVVSSGRDGKIKFWDFATGGLHHEINWHGSITVLRMVYHRPNDLVAVACSDEIIRVIDIETKNIIRELPGCEGTINNVCFSNDGQWVLAVSSDSVLRVWDLPTGHLIEAIRLRSPCTALAFSNTGEFLALALEDSIGIDVVTNSSLFKRVSTRRIANNDLALLEAPTASGEGGASLLAPAFEDEEVEVDDEFDGAPTSVEQLSSEMTSLSVVPRSRWQTLLHLDLIRERNKPKEPPKAPEKAPFFLPSLARDSKGPANGIINTEAADAGAINSQRPRFLKTNADGTASQMTKLLRSGSYLPLLNHLKELPPSAADVEIRSLNPIAPYGELLGFVEALIRRLGDHKDYELVQTWMAVFLKCHSEVLQEALTSEEGQPLLLALREWKAAQQKEAARLGGLAGYCSGIVSFLRTTR